MTESQTPSTSPTPPSPADETKSRKLLIIVSIVAIVAICAAVTLAVVLLMSQGQTPIGNKQCTYNGKVYNPGDSFPADDNCNSCGCTNGEVVCTLIACEAPGVTVQPTTSLAPSPTTGEGLPVYFGKPVEETDYNTLATVERAEPAEGTSVYTYLLGKLFSGPTAEEKTSGIVPVASVSGDSNCSGKDYQFVRTVSVLTVNFCRDLAGLQNPGISGAYAGITLAMNSRLFMAFEKTLSVEGVTTLVIKDKDGNCFAQDAGVNTACSE